MASASTIVKRVSAASSLLRRRRCQTLSSSASAGFARRTIRSRPALSSFSSSQFSSRQFVNQVQKYHDDAKYFSSLAQELDGDDDDDDEVTGGGGGGGGGHRRRPSSPLLPTRHSRNLPPPVCPPASLRSEVESIFDAPIGSLIAYAKSESAALPKGVEEEMADAYYASDAIVQRVEYVMRGLNARISGESFVSRSLKRGAMLYEDGDGGGDGDAEALAREDCFRAMLDLVERMTKEGESYDELRTRVRSQLVNPSSSAEDSGSSSDSDSSSSDDDSDSDNDDEKGGVDGRADDSFNEWAETIERNMSKAKIGNPGMKASSNEDEDDEEISQELYQFGADPGVTVHMCDLVLDSLACLCQERYGNANAKKASDSIDLAELMPEDSLSPPELAKDMLDTVLHRHWMDGGDIGLGSGGSDDAVSGVAQGVGVGAGTGAGGLARARASPDAQFDIRTCPTPMTFNAVLRVAANFDPAAHAEAAESARILGGSMGMAPSSSGGGADPGRERERLRDVTIDAALSTFSRMQYCAALTLRTLRNVTGNATSRAARKKRARLLAGNYKGGRQNKNFVSGRNSATYSYLIQAVANCVPPSLSRGNMTFGLYHKGCVQEGVMDERLVETMRGVGGYYGGDEEDVLEDAVEDGNGVDVPSPPVSNGPIFDSFMMKELAGGEEAALNKGRKLRHDRNYKLRRHMEWDDTY